MKQLTLSATKNTAEKICDLLLGAGALSASIEDSDVDTSLEKPIFLEKDWIEERLWDHCLIKALFSEDVNETLLKKKLSASKFKFSFEIEELPEKDWVRESLKDFKPLKIGKKLWVVPSWTTPPRKDAINVIFDPGMAFGTGKHATTKLCLEWLEKNIQGGEKVLDYGSGSGILGISAAKLGAGKVVGVDIDPQAILSSKSNAKLNKVKFHLHYPTDLPKTKFDLIVANILANPLKRLAEEFSILSGKGTRIALSGILAHQVPEIVKAYSKWFEMGKPRVKDNWALLSGRFR